MTMTPTRWLIVLAGLAVVFGLPLLGKWARGPRAATCALDGVAIDPVYRVRVVDDQGTDRQFCCIQCAALWLSRQPAKPRAVWVTDETTGREIDAASAWFVRSLVVTEAHTRNRVHAFGSAADAGRHARAAYGAVLPDSESPFAAFSLPRGTAGRPVSIGKGSSALTPGSASLHRPRVGPSP
jgi:hypothetical protein